MIHPACFGTVFDAAPPPGGFPPRWAVVTAYARTGTVRPFVEDAGADAALATELVLAQVPHWRVTGRSASGDHAEPGWGCDLAAADALALGRRFGQTAIFQVDGGDLWVAECDAGGACVRIGALAPKMNPPVTGLGGDAGFVKLAGDEVVRRAALLRFLGPEDARADNFRALLGEADDSGYGADDWCAAAEDFQNRLEVAGRSSPFAHKLGYLSCCASAALVIPPMLRPPLAEAFAAMWAEHGYEG